MKANLNNFSQAAIVILSIVAAPTSSRPQEPSTQDSQPVQGFSVSVGGKMNRAAMLADLLSLTSSQEEQARAIFSDEETASKPLVDQLKQAYDALTAAEKAAADNPEIEPLAANVASISGQILATDARAESQVYALLTESQREKLERMPHPLFVPSGPLLPPGQVFAVFPTRTDLLDQALDMPTEHSS